MRVEDGASNPEDSEEVGRGRWTGGEGRGGEGQYMPCSCISLMGQL